MVSQGLNRSQLTASSAVQFLIQMICKQTDDGYPQSWVDKNGHICKSYRYWTREHFLIVKENLNKEKPRKEIDNNKASIVIKTYVKHLHEMHKCYFLTQN